MPVAPDERVPSPTVRSLRRLRGTRVIGRTARLGRRTHVWISSTAVPAKARGCSRRVDVNVDGVAKSCYVRRLEHRHEPPPTSPSWPRDLNAHRGDRRCRRRRERWGGFRSRPIDHGALPRSGTCHARAEHEPHLGSGGRVNDSVPGQAPPTPDQSEFPEGIRDKGICGRHARRGPAGWRRVLGPVLGDLPVVARRKDLLSLSDHTSCLQLIEAVAGAGGLLGKGPVTFPFISRWRRDLQQPDRGPRPRHAATRALRPPGSTLRRRRPTSRRRRPHRTSRCRRSPGERKRCHSRSQSSRLTLAPPSTGTSRRRTAPRCRCGPTWPWGRRVAGERVKVVANPTAFSEPKFCRLGRDFRCPEFRGVALPRQPLTEVTQACATAAGSSCLEVTSRFSFEIAAVVSFASMPFSTFATPAVSTDLRMTGTM